MPLTVPAGQLTKANFVTPYLKPTLDSTEATATAAQTAAAAAQTTANAKYTKPEQGIPRADLAVAVYAGMPVVVTQSAAGQPYLDNGTTVTAGNRIAGTFRIFIGVDSPVTLGLAADNDIVILVSA